MTYNPTGGRVSTSERDRAIVGSLAAGGIAAGAVRLTLGSALWAAQRFRTGASIHRKIVGPVTWAMSTKSNLESIYRITQGGYRPAFDVKYEPYTPFWALPIPHIGHIPLIRPRLDIGTRPIGESRSGENTSFTQVVSGPLQTRKSMRGASAPRKRSSRTRTFSRRRRAKYCRKHKRYDMCHMYTKH